MDRAVPEEVDGLERAFVIDPDSASREAFVDDPLDTSYRAVAARAGLRQGNQGPARRAFAPGKAAAVHRACVDR